MFDKKQITYEIASELAPYKSPIPEWGEDDPEFLALADDVGSRGIDQPLICLGKRVVDGRARWRAARRWQIREVPTVQCAPEEVVTIILAGLVHRRTLTKSAKAYLAFPLMAPALDELKANRVRFLQSGGKEHSPLSGLCSTVEELADRIGLGRTLLFYAKQVHKAFAEDPELKARFEPSILVDGAGLGGVLAGIAGRQTTKGVERVDRQQLDLFKQGLTTLRKRFDYWEKFDAQQKIDAENSVLEFCVATPRDLRGVYVKGFARANKLEGAQ